MILASRRCNSCNIFIDTPQQRRFCPFCGHEVQFCNRQVLRDAFERFGTDLGDTETYVQVVLRTGEEDSYLVIGNVERLNRHMKTLRAA